ncbi:hypothetical protein G7Y89_g15586 [Cudoniella acicularis]|uniref:Heterokaryon incompatibility domain-containing protein n=1 Tax=Cudoniella acicularis TaxID=354080 RepID=A0A8H4QKL8_9HELO|nr:hypothetical protein G7Y89_g15586 [Cudoniella acicularis]
MSLIKFKNLLKHFKHRGDPVVPSCAICDGLQGGMIDEDGYQKSYHVPLRIIQSRKTSGCGGCGLLYDAVDIFKPTGIAFQLLDLSLEWGSPGNGNSLRLSLCKDESGIGNCEVIGDCYLMCKQDYLSPWTAIKSLNDETAIVGNPSSPAAFQKIRKWIANCETHSQCSPAQPYGGLPQRVLDVGAGLDSNQVHLYEGKGEIHPYITLSHCWGTSEIGPPKTLTENLHDRRCGIQWTELNKTFQDAVFITRELGIRYLWIDSLCIIQDDEDDWKEQSGQMMHIYESAYLTIAATGASSGQDGCFVDRVPPIELRDGILLRERIDHNPWFKSPFTREEIYPQTDPLLYRGWCFQERVLSTRVIHYTSKELVFECKTSTICECGNPHRNPYTDTFKSSPHRTFNWTKMVEDYTKANLTRSTDILVALSGVASSLKSWNKGKYIAGLWEEDIVENLFWSTTRPSICRRPPSYTAPSFSWASVIGEVHFGNPHKGPDRKCHVSLIDAASVTDPVNIYGAVSDGFLTLQGTLIPVSLEKVDDSPKVRFDLPRILLNTSPIEDDSHIRHGQRIKSSSWLLPLVSSLAGLDTIDDWEYALNEGLYCLPIYSPWPKGLRFSLVYALILGLDSNNKYHRIGYARFDDVPDWKDVIITQEVTII